MYVPVVRGAPRLPVQYPYSHQSEHYLQTRISSAANILGGSGTPVASTITIDLLQCLSQCSQLSTSWLGFRCNKVLTLSNAKVTAKDDSRVPCQSKVESSQRSILPSLSLSRPSLNCVTFTSGLKEGRIRNVVEVEVVAERSARLFLASCMQPINLVAEGCRIEWQTVRPSCLQTHSAVGL